MPRKIKEPRQRTTVRISEDILAALDAEAEASGFGSRNMLMEHILAKYLKNEGHKLGLKVLL